MREINEWNRERARLQLGSDVRCAVPAVEGGPPKAEAPRIWGLIGVVPQVLAAAFNLVWRRAKTVDRFIAVTDGDVVVMEALLHDRRTAPGREIGRVPRRLAAVRPGSNGMLIVHVAGCDLWVRSGAAGLLRDQLHRS